MVAMGPRQCGQWSGFRQYYCELPAAHDEAWHAAAHGSVRWQQSGCAISTEDADDLLPTERVQIRVCGWVEFWARVTCALIFLALSLLFGVVIAR